MAKLQRVDGSRSRKPKVTSEILDRQPPCSLEAEMAVLGSILLKPDVCDEVMTILQSRDFYDDVHQKLYDAMVAMHDAGRKIDVTLLVEQLQQQGVLEAIGGVPTLARIGNSVATPAFAEQYARIVRRQATRRALIEASTEILRDAYQDTEDVDELANRAEQKIFAVLERGKSAQVHDIREILHMAMDRIEARMKGEHMAGGVETGFRELDKLTGGLHNSELVVLAARPGMGKTALAMNITEYVVMKLRRPVLFVSLEMSAIELADRMLCSMAQVNSHRLRDGSLSRDDRKKLVEKMAELSETPLTIDDSPSRTVSEVAAVARRTSRHHHGLAMIVLDYLQLIEPDNPMESRQEQVAKMTRRLKGLAREMNVPVLCLAQLNRQAETSKDSRPRLSHLRESGAIEQDADVVMFVHREEYYRSGEERQEVAGEAQVLVAKQRNGPVGDVPLVWRKEYTRFADPAPPEYEEFAQFNDPF